MHCECVRLELTRGFIRNIRTRALLGWLAWWGSISGPFRWRCVPGRSGSQASSVGRDERRKEIAFFYFYIKKIKFQKYILNKEIFKNTSTVSQSRSVSTASPRPCKNLTPCAHTRIFVHACMLPSMWPRILRTSRWRASAGNRAPNEYPPDREYGSNRRHAVAFPSTNCVRVCLVTTKFPNFPSHPSHLLLHQNIKYIK